MANQLWTRMVAKEATRPADKSRMRTFRDRVPWLGPVVFMFSTLYFAVQIFVAQVWEPSYSWVNNSISDLGNTSCDPAVLCSPRHPWMNLEFAILGLVMAGGSLLIFQEFTERTPQQRLVARIGFSCLAAGGAGAILVGRFPENTVPTMHEIGAALAIGVGTTGIFVLGLGVSLPKTLHWGMIVLAPLAVVAGVLFATHVDLGIGPGLMERIAAYPETVWLLIFGIYISYTHHSSSRAPRLSA